MLVSGLTCAVAARRLPRFDWIAFGVRQAREPPIRVALGIEFHGNSRRFQLPHHRVQIAGAKIGHPLFSNIAKVLGVLLERRECRRSGLLLPGRVVVIIGNESDPQMVAIPFRERLWAPRPKKYPPIPSTFSRLLRC